MFFSDIFSAFSKLPIIAVGLLSLGCQSYPSNILLLRNPNLSTINPEFPGNAYKNGSFVGPYRSINSGSESTWNYLSWKLNPSRKRSSQETTSDIPIIQYDQKKHGRYSHFTWLGHATVLLRVKGKTILVDPILETPKYFHGSRLGEIPIKAENLSVDYLLATRAHRDHLDKSTVLQLTGNSIKAFTPLKMGPLLRSWRPHMEIQEAGWYQTYDTKSEIRITLLPAFHWSRRTILDTNSVLWGSYLIEAGDTTVFIAGDTGYSDHFKEIGELFNAIDYAILPIGSYEPDHIHKNSHMTPEQALQAFTDLNARTMIPVHYGTFDLSDEPVAEPMKRLLQAIDEKQIAENSVLVLSIGEVHYL